MKEPTRPNNHITGPPQPPPDVEKAIRAAVGKLQDECATPVNVNQKVIAQVFGVSEPWLERDRWLHEGKAPGVPFLKLDRKVLYNWIHVWRWFEEKQTYQNDQSA